MLQRRAKQHISKETNDVQVLCPLRLGNDCQQQQQKAVTAT